MEIAGVVSSGQLCQARLHMYRILSFDRVMELGCFPSSNNASHGKQLSTSA